MLLLRKQERNLDMSSNWMPRKLRNELYARDEMVCCYCGKTCLPYSKEIWKQNPHDVATLDHIISQWHIAQVSESDVDFTRKQKDPRNIVVVCNGCNSSKKKTDLYIWCNTKGLDYGLIVKRIASRINA